MKQRRFLQFLLPVLIVLAVALTVHQLSQIVPRAPRAERPPVQPPLVTVSTFTRQDYPLLIRAQGTVQPKAKTMLVTEVNGKVLELAPEFVAGGLVKQGAVLLTLEQADYRVALHTAEANLAKARAQLAEEKARAAVAREERKKRGFTNGRLAPELALRKPQLARDQANVDAAKAELERAQRNLERTKIRAPYDALISRRQVDIGQFVTRGAVIGELFAIRIAEVRLALTRDELRRLKLPRLKLLSADAQRPTVVLTKLFADGSEQWQGVIDRSERVVQAQSRMTYVVARIDDPYGLERLGEYTELAFGSFVTAEIHAGTLEDVIRIPRSAQRSDGRVMIVDEESRVQLRQVEVQHQDSQWLYISSGVEPGEALALTPLPTATEGMLVRQRKQQSGLIARPQVASGVSREGGQP